MASAACKNIGAPAAEHITRQKRVKSPTSGYSWGEKGWDHTEEMDNGNGVGGEAEKEERHEHGSVTSGFLDLACRKKVVEMSVGDQNLYYGNSHFGNQRQDVLKMTTRRECTSLSFGLLRDVSVCELPWRHHRDPLTPAIHSYVKNKNTNKI